MMRPTARQPFLVLGTALALSVAVLAGCGSTDETASSPTPTLTVSPTPGDPAPPKTPKSDSPPPLDHASVVIVRELPDGQRRLVAYDFTTAQTKDLVALSRDENPAVSPDGTHVVVERANGPWRDPITTHWLAKSGSRLVLINLINGDETQLTPIVEGTRAQTPQWNRHDGWIYYITSTPTTGNTRTTHLIRLQPDTGQTQPVPHGRGVIDFTIEPNGRHAWVSTFWRWPDSPTRGGAWRLNLNTGKTSLLGLHGYQGGDVAFTPSGNRVAITANVESGWLSVAPWPDGWSPPPDAWWRARVIYQGPSLTTFGDLGWQPNASHVVLQSEHGRMNAKLTHLLPVDGWYVSLIDRRTGDRTDITPPGAADTSFDIWWPTP
jgi:hypothetical protein